MLRPRSSFVLLSESPWFTAESPYLGGYVTHSLVLRMEYDSFAEVLFFFFLWRSRRVMLPCAQKVVYCPYSFYIFHPAFYLHVCCSCVLTPGWEAVVMYRGGDMLGYHVSVG